MIDLAALRAEIQADPLGLGYSTVDNALTARLLNEPRASIRITRGSIPTQEILDATDFSELTQASYQWLYEVLVGREEVVVTPAVTTLVREIFAAGTTSRTQLAALKDRDGSRAEELFGSNVVVRSKHVNEALNG